MAREISGAGPLEGRLVTGQRTTRKDGSTHVDAVSEAYSDQGSIPCASTESPRTALQAGAVRALRGAVPGGIVSQDRARFRPTALRTSPLHARWPMRKYLPILLTLALGCETTGLAMSSCSGTGPNGICGIWIADSRVPGASLVMDLQLREITVSGTGSYSIEAGRSGSLSVSGTYQPP